jgi:hypothetical protein
MSQTRRIFWRMKDAFFGLKLLVSGPKDMALYLPLGVVTYYLMCNSNKQCKLLFS